MIHTFQDLQDRAVFLADHINNIKKLHQLDFKENGFIFSQEVLTYFTQHCSYKIADSHYLKVKSFSTHPNLRNEAILSALEKIYSHLFTNQYPRPSLKAALGNQLPLIPKTPRPPRVARLMESPRATQANSLDTILTSLNVLGLSPRKVASLPTSASTTTAIATTNSSFRSFPSLPPLFNPSEKSSS